MVYETPPPSLFRKRRWWSVSAIGPPRTQLAQAWPGLVPRRSSLCSLPHSTTEPDARQHPVAGHSLRASSPVPRISPAFPVPSCSRASRIEGRGYTLLTCLAGELSRCNALAGVRCTSLSPDAGLQILASTHRAVVHGGWRGGVLPAHLPGERCRRCLDVASPLPAGLHLHGSMGLLGLSTRDSGPAGAVGIRHGASAAHRKPMFCPLPPGPAP